MTCEESIKYLDSLIKTLGQSQYQSLWNWEQPLTEIKEMLESKRVIELPCKVGDTVYVLNRGNLPQKMILDAPDIRCHCSDEDNLCMALCRDKKHNICAYRLMNDGSDIGKTVFLTKSEAEAKLKELKKCMN